MSPNVWQKTKEAVADFRKLLLCSKCSELMSEPLCLGACEHMFCRSCAGSCAGGECSVCFSPAWVKDIQVNRQLNNITDLFRNLEALLNPPEVSATPPNNPCELSETSPIVKPKKKYRIWTSPRSHQIRCRVESPGETSLLPADSRVQTQPGPQKALVKQPDASVYNFPASSQDSGSSSPPRTKKRGGGSKKKRKTKIDYARKAVERAQAAVKRTQKRRQQLEVINQQWGFGVNAGAAVETQEDDEGEGSGREEECRRSRKRVSFQSLDAPLPEDHPKENAPPSENRVTTPRPATSDTGLLSGPSTVPPESIKDVASPAQRSSPCRLPKRALPTEAGADQQSTPKRPRTSPGGGGRRLAAVDELSALSTPPLSPHTLSSPRCSSPGGARRELVVCLGPSPTSGRRSQGRQSPCSPAFMKRNHKGESPLHLAAIKGDVEAVRRLLEEGADPNLKDNAGWTPLHEACNHGHLAVVEALILAGALLNTPGYQNDSPLHDAVRNGHAAIAKLLLEHGASQSVLNMFGLRAVDCAETPEMREILQKASEGGRPLSSPLTPPASLSKIGGCGQKDGRLTLLGSKLTQPQRRQLAQAARLLGARLADAFSSTVTHVVVKEGAMPTTLSTLQGILNGCWILRFSWLGACLQAGGRAPEAEHEVGEGPQRSRLNRDNLLPPLFDGCFFFLLGSFKRPDKGDLLKLIREGGGQVLSRQPKPDSDVTQTLSAAAYHAWQGSDQALCTQYIIYEPQSAYKPSRVRLGKVWSAPTSWLLDCISAFQLLPVPGLEPPQAP